MYKENHALVNYTPKVKLLEVQFFMNKYSDEFKIKAVQMALNGNAVKKAENINGIKKNMAKQRIIFSKGILKHMS